MNDIGNIILRILILFFAAASSEVAMGKKMWAISFLLFAVWLTFFRLTLYRVTSIYLGVFSHEVPSFVDNLRILVQSSTIANITDLLTLLGIIGIFRWVSRFSSK